MKTINVTIYQYSDLDERGKARVRESNRDTWLEGRWYNGVYDDAENIGLTIKSFDLYRREIDVRADDVDDTARAIEKDHGIETPTYKALAYYRTGDSTSFKNTLAHAYLQMLVSEYRYLRSDEFLDGMLSENNFTYYYQDGTPVPNVVLNSQILDERKVI
jgi:hypothetical protein